MAKQLKITKGEKFGQLTIVKKVDRINGERIKYLCKCDCGKTKEILRCSLLSQKTKSCGCLRSKKQRNKFLVHGGKGTRLYSIWKDMRKRCYNLNSKSYPYYGARGISVCEEWQNFSAFKIWALTNGYKKTLTLDRKNNYGNYTPENCRWATLKTQSRNKRNNNILEFKGQKLCVTEWSEKVGIPDKTLMGRIRLGWSIEDILTKPVRVMKNNV